MYPNSEDNKQSGNLFQNVSSKELAEVALKLKEIKFDQNWFANYINVLAPYGAEYMNVKGCSRSKENFNTCCQKADALLDREIIKRFIQEHITD